METIELFLIVVKFINKKKDNTNLKWKINVSESILSRVIMKILVLKLTLVITRIKI